MTAKCSLLPNYGVFFGRPKGALTADGTGAPALATYGLQLFQCAVMSLGWPLAKNPICNWIQESLSFLTIQILMHIPLTKSLFPTGMRTAHTHTSKTLRFTTD